MRYCAFFNSAYKLVYRWLSFCQPLLKNPGCLFTKPQASLFGACLCTGCAGIVYAFSLYGPQLASKLGYSSVQLNLIAVSGNVGVYLSTPFFGYAADVLSPSRVTLISSVLFLAGFSAISLTFQGVLPYSSPWIMSFYYFVVGNACACANITALSTTGHNFRQQRGIGIGVPVTLFGLSAFIFSTIYHLFFVKEGVPDTAGFIQFLAFSTAISTFIGSFTLNKIEYQELDQNIELDEMPDLDTSPDSEQPKFKANRALSLDIGGRELFCNTDAQLLYLIIMLLAGTGLMYINNIGTVLRTLQIDHLENLPALQSYNVSTLSLFNCLGRLAFALSSDYAASIQFRRLSYLLFSAFVVSLAQFFVAFTPASWVTVCSAALGFGYGMMFAVTTTVTSLWFGTRNYGSNWGWLSTGPGLGGQILSLIFGYIYDSHAITYQSGSETVKECKGDSSCYSTSFYIASFLSLISAIVVLALKKRREPLHS